uniref:Cystatin domain-containing protein n=1 Tax=Anas platyrhynchos TaxID=8839 RepID=A0A8B9ZIW7_ANAPL
VVEGKEQPKYEPPNSCFVFFFFFLQVKAEFERKEDRTFDIFQAIVYRTQVVAGTNYFIKVQISDTSYAHLVVFQALPYEKKDPIIIRYVIDKTRDDPLEYF